MLAYYYIRGEIDKEINESFCLSKKSQQGNEEETTVWVAYTFCFDFWSTNEHTSSSRKMLGSMFS